MWILLLLCSASLIAGDLSCDDPIVNELTERDLPTKCRLHLRSKRSRLGDTMEHLQSFFKMLNLPFHEEYHHFGRWAHGAWDDEAVEVQKKNGSVKAIAIKYIAHGKMGLLNKSVVSKQAVKFFTPHKEHLGSLFDDIKTLSFEMGEDEDEDEDEDEEKDDLKGNRNNNNKEDGDKKGDKVGGDESGDNSND